MKDILATLMRNDLQLLITTADDRQSLLDGNLNELVPKLYPDTRYFVANVADAMVERGYSKAQVAAAMGETSLPFFADFIARNGGDIGPAPALPARRYPPAGSQPPPPIYGAPFGPPPPSGPPSVTSTSAVGSQLPAWLSPYPSRTILKQKLSSVGRVQAFMTSVPADAGLKPYNPRAGTDMRSVWETLIRNIRAVVPSY